MKINIAMILTIMSIMMIMMTTMINGQVCLTPLTAFGNSTIAPPVLDTTATRFVANPSGTGTNDNRFLSIKIDWATVGNRVLDYVGIGDQNAANGGCQSIVSQTGGWKFSSSDTCFDEVKANYTWPLALFTPSCAALLTVDETDANFTKISFDLIIKFNETYTTTRAGLQFTQVKTIASKLPIILQFPKTVTVSTRAVRVFSASSVEVSADLIAQDVTNNPPYTITYVTLLGASFALDQPTVSYGGQYDPALKTVAFTGDQIVQTTRQSTWVMSVTPTADACVLTGIYNITYNLFWTGVDQNGNPLPAAQNPIPNNSTVTVTFDIQSQSFCATTLTSSLERSLKVYDQPPNTATYYEGVDERLGYFTGARIYFGAKVTSDNLPLRTVRLTDFYITFGDASRTDLILNGTQTAEAATIDFQLSIPLDAQPNDQALFNMIVAPEVFQVLQDQDTEYIFNALLTVTYSTTGSKKKRDLVPLSFTSKDFNKLNQQKVRALPTTGSTSLTTSAKMTLQQTAVTATPTKANIINASSASGLIGSALSLLSLFVFLLW